MCGICGIYYNDHDRDVAPATIMSMRDSMTHRGPDDAGIFLDGPLGLGMRRLSIIDLATGNQPMSSEDGSLWVVFNGEIYNFQELRRKLETLGYRFRTRSDTETILHAYAEFGIDAIKLFNGMFAIALWDGRRRRLIVIRDRLGVKPLYWTQTPEAFLFASEIKALLASGLVATKPDLSGLGEFFRFGFVAGDRTLFEGIHSVMPGELLVIEAGRVSRCAYWDVPLWPEREKAHDHERTEGRALDLLEDSVRLRLISDVPVGTFCSGGLDSSFISAIAARQAPGRINTFSVGFPASSYDESPYAAQVARHVGSEHHLLPISGEEFGDALPLAVWHNDEPLNHPNSVAILSLSKLCRRDVKVVLTGEGADELLAGYPRYSIIRWLDGEDWFSRLVALTTRLPAPASARRFAKLRQAAILRRSERAIWNAAFLGESMLGRIAGIGSSATDLTYRQQCWDYARTRGADPMDALTYLEIKTYLVSILNRQDKMSMAASIEARVPFLDYRFVEFCMSLPSRVRFDRWTRKGLLRKIAEPFLPARIIDRSKSGFGVPLDLWFRKPKALGRYFDVISDSLFLREAGFDRLAVGRIMEPHLRGEAGFGELLWRVLCLELWYRAFFVDGVSTARRALEGKQERSTLGAAHRDLFGARGPAAPRC